jgi:hypothetical protein
MDQNVFGAKIQKVAQQFDRLQGYCIEKRQARQGFRVAGALAFSRRVLAAIWSCVYNESGVGMAAHGLNGG